MKKIFFASGIFLLGAMASLGTAFAVGLFAGQFPDVDLDAYYAESLDMMVAKNVIKGYSNGNFGPNDAVTRAQLVTILDRYDQQLVTAGENKGIGILQILICDGFSKEDLKSSSAKSLYSDYCPNEGIGY